MIFCKQSYDFFQIVVGSELKIFSEENPGNNDANIGHLSPRRKHLPTKKTQAARKNIII